MNIIKIIIVIALYTLLAAEPFIFWLILNEISYRENEEKKRRLEEKQKRKGEK